MGPLTALGTVARRRSRLFHPVGVVLRASVVGLHRDGPLGQAARALEGPALVRLSSAWWKRREWIDALGFAIRFRGTGEVSPAPAAGDQDLLFATIRFPLTTLLAPLTTRQHDFTANHYYAVSPFEVPGVGRAKLRLAPPPAPPGGAGATREERLRAAVASGEASFQLQLRRRPPRGSWEPLCQVHLVEEVALDQEALAFWPFRTGRGVVPRGFVHALRRGAYAGGQRARGQVQS